MPGIYESIDLKWTNNGDFFANEEGDISSTEDDLLESMASEVVSILKSSTGDWENYPNFAANLSEFIGEPNTRDTGRRLEQRVKTSINLAGVASSSDIQVRAIPIDIDSLAVIVTIYTYPSRFSQLEENGQVVIYFVFDLSSGGAFFLSKEKITNYFPVME